MPFKIIVFTEKRERKVLFVDAEKAVHNTSWDLIKLQNESDVPVAFIPREIEIIKLQDGIEGCIGKGKKK